MQIHNSPVQNKKQSQVVFVQHGVPCEETVKLSLLSQFKWINVHFQGILTIPSNSLTDLETFPQAIKNATHVIQQKVGDDETTSLDPCFLSLFL